MGETLPKRVAFLSLVLIGYVVLFFVCDGLRFPVEKDEDHFWATSQLFAEPWPPGLERLRDYPELNTPLPFIVFGTLEHWTGDGLFAGRLSNLLLSAVLVALVALSGPSPLRAALAACGLLAFPYFLGVSIHLYTDTLPCLLAALGFVLHCRGRFALSALSFVLAIASRQYAVAVPAGLALAEIAGVSTTGAPGRARRAAWPAGAAATLAAWWLFFGAFGPAAEVARQQVATASALALRPEHSIYFLATLGAYFVLPVAVLGAQRRRIGFRPSVPAHPQLATATDDPKHQPALAADTPESLEGRGGGPGGGRGLWRWGGDPQRFVGALLVVAAAAYAFPPVGNRDYAIASMGFLDRALRIVFDDGVRVATLGALAALAGAWFLRRGALTGVVIAQALILAKAHIAWDKYALPTIAIGWWCVAADRSES